MSTRPLRLYYIYIALLIAGLIGACQPKDVPQPDSLPNNLSVNTYPDSIITLTEQVDFSTISETGQGPTGSLIRWNKENSPNRIIQANTYDAQNRLVGVFSIDYGFGYQGFTKYQYQGELLAESFYGYRSSLTQPLSEIQPGYITKCQYNQNKQLVRLLGYSRISETNRFKLTSVRVYQYGSTGQLQLTWPMSLENSAALEQIDHWQNGDRTKAEVYYPSKEYLPYPITNIEEYTYNQQPNPYAQIGDPFKQISTHNFIRYTNYKTTINPYATSPYNYSEIQYDYDQQYDAQGRVSIQRMRSLLPNPDRWSEWGDPIRFTYAP